MAQRYGKHAPAETDWDMLAESLKIALTPRQPKAAPGPKSHSRPPVASVILAIALAVTFPITMVVVNSWLGQFASILWIAFIVGMVALAIAQLVVQRRESRQRSNVQSKASGAAQGEASAKVGQLIDGAKRGDFSGLSSLPEARPIAAECYAKQQIGLAMDADLPDEVQTAHSVEVAVSGDGAEQSRSTIDHIIATSAGIVVAATKHWPGTLSLDDEGRFSAGQNHPANEYRQASVAALAAMADQVCNGDVALILLIIDDGFVLGSGVETEVNGRRIIAIEREHAVDFIAHIHAQGALAQVPDLRLIDEKSPQLTM